MKDDNFPEDIWNRIQEKVKQLIEKYHRPAEEVVMDDVDLRGMLKVSRRTTLSYRQSGKLKFYKIENKIFYLLSEVITFIKSYKNGTSN